MYALTCTIGGMGIFERRQFEKVCLLYEHGRSIIPFLSARQGRLVGGCIHARCLCLCVHVLSYLYIYSILLDVILLPWQCMKEVDGEISWITSILHSRDSSSTYSTCLWTCFFTQPSISLYWRRIRCMSYHIYTHTGDLNWHSITCWSSLVGPADSLMMCSKASSEIF